MRENKSNLVSKFLVRFRISMLNIFQTYYPANFLRNVALNNTRTDYVFLSDADFIPMYGVHSHIQKAIQNGLLDDPKIKRVWTHFYRPQRS